MIFVVLNIGFSKDDLRQLISLTDTNKDGRIDVSEFHKMLYAEDITKAEAAMHEDDDDENIEVVEEVSDESDIEESPVKKSAAASSMPDTKKEVAKIEDDDIDEDVIDEDVVDDEVEDSIQEEPAGKGKGATRA